VVSAFDEVREELFRSLYSLLGNYEDAQDAVQSAFLRCWRARDQVPELNNVRGWIWRVGINAGRDLRDRERRRRMAPLSAVEGTACSPNSSPLDFLEKQEETERLRGALGHLRPDEREVFQLRHDAALSYEEIAQRRNRPVGTGKTQMRSAVRKLRQALGEGA